jgi:hypothetical protein
MVIMPMIKVGRTKQENGRGNGISEYQNIKIKHQKKTSVNGLL